jgi:hypothetical protein
MAVNVVDHAPTGSRLLAVHHPAVSEPLSRLIGMPTPATLTVTEAAGKPPS